MWSNYFKAPKGPGTQVSVGKAFQAKVQFPAQERARVTSFGHPGRADSVAGRGECGFVTQATCRGPEATLRTWLLLWGQRELWRSEWRWLARAPVLRTGWQGQAKPEDQPETLVAQPGRRPGDGKSG